MDNCEKNLKVINYKEEEIPFYEEKNKIIGKNFWIYKYHFQKISKIFNFKISPLYFEYFIKHFEKKVQSNSYWDFLLIKGFLNLDKDDLFLEVGSGNGLITILSSYFCNNIISIEKNFLKLEICFKNLFFKRNSSRIFFFLVNFNLFLKKFTFIFKKIYIDIPLEKGDLLNLQRRLSGDAKIVIFVPNLSRLLITLNFIHEETSFSIFEILDTSLVFFEFLKKKENYVLNFKNKEKKGILLFLNYPKIL